VPDAGAGSFHVRFRLETDVGEQHNVAGAHPEIVARLKDLLEKYEREGRSVPLSPMNGRHGLRPRGAENDPACLNSLRLARTTVEVVPIEDFERNPPAGFGL